MVTIQGLKIPSDVDKAMQLASFLRETLCLGASALNQLVVQVYIVLVPIIVSC